MKIVYCASQLHRPGGTEKVLTEKANYLANEPGFEIHIITEDQHNRTVFFKLNENIKLHDINISALNKKVIPGITFVENVFVLRKMYTELINDIDPDVVIVVERGYLDFVIPFIKSHAIKIREFHFAKKAVNAHIAVMAGWFSKIRHTIRYSVLFKMFNEYDYLILLTLRDQKEGNYRTKTKVFPNMLNSMPATVSSLETKNVISVGSMYDKRKNFAEQIILWKDIKQTHPDWILNIYGDGRERANLQKLIIENDLTGNVILHGNSNDMPDNYSNASIFLFTSQAEGFPMVLLEALSHGLPCVAYDAPTGPSDIIIPNKNGFLIDNGNQSLLKEKLLFLMDNTAERKLMGIEARNSSKMYMAENIMLRWKEFFKSLI